MAASIRRATPIALAATLSVVSKNQNNLISVVRKPKRKQGFHDHAFQSIPLVLGTRKCSTLNFQKMCKVKASVNDKVDAISTWQSEFLEREIEIANAEYQELKENELNRKDVSNLNSK